MKITPKRSHLILKLTKTEVRELAELLVYAVREKQRWPLHWCMKGHKARAKLLAEITGVTDGVLHRGRDPDETFGRETAELGQGVLALGGAGGAHEDDDRLLSEDYAKAYREGKRFGTEGARR